MTRALELSSLSWCGMVIGLILLGLILVAAGFVGAEPLESTRANPLPRRRLVPLIVIGLALAIYAVLVLVGILPRLSFT